MNKKRDVLSEKLTDYGKRLLEERVGMELTPEIAKDCDWVDEHYYSEEAQEKRERAASEKLKTMGATLKSVIMLTPQGHFISGNVGPLVEVLRKEEADANLQAWLADQIEKGAFAQRKSILQRVKDHGALYDAACDVEDITKLLKSHGMRRRAFQRAIEVAAFHRTFLQLIDEQSGGDTRGRPVSVERLTNYLKRSKKDRKRLPRIGG